MRYIFFMYIAVHAVPYLLHQLASVTRKDTDIFTSDDSFDSRRKESPESCLAILSPIFHQPDGTYQD